MKHQLEKPTPKKVRKTYKYICNGKFFETFELAESYANANGWSVSHTSQIKGKALIHVSGSSNPGIR